MSKDSDEAFKTRMASTIIASGENKVKVPIKKAMKMAGFTTPEREDKTKYQQVRRAAIREGQRKQLDTWPSDAVPGDLVIHSEESGSTTVSSLLRTTTASVVAALGGSSTGTGSAASNTSGVRRRLAEEDDEGDKKAAAKPETKRRRTSVQKQRDDAVHARQKEANRQAMKVITVAVDKNNKRAANDPEKTSNAEIIRRVNKAYKSSVDPKTVSRYVKNNMIGVSPMKRGPVGDFPKQIWNALKGAYVTYLRLEQHSTTNQSGINAMSLKVNKCVNKIGLNNAFFV